MSPRLAVTVLAAFTSLALAPMPPQAKPTDLNQEPESVMTGTTADRSAAIEKATAKPIGLVKQLNLNGTPLSQVFHLFSLQNKIDIRPNWDELEKQGIPRDMNLTISLYDATFPEALDAVIWQLRPKSGGVGWKIDNGTLAIIPIAEAKPATETDDQRRQDAELQKSLTKVSALELPDQEMSIEQLVYSWSLATKANVIVDWKELEKVRVNKDAKITPKLKSPTGEVVLKTAIAAMNAKEGVVGYEIWGGILRISTRERLDKEKPKPADTKPTGLP